MSKKPILLAIVCFACDIKDSVPAGTPSCGSVTVSGWTGSSYYNFKSYNFTCEGLPTTVDFEVAETVFETEGGLSKSDAETAGDDAVAHFNSVAGTRLTLARVTAFIDSRFALDGTNVILFEDGIAPVVGETGFSQQYVNSTNDLSCDVVLYSKRYDSDGNLEDVEWTVGTPSSTEYRAQDILGHELGHCLGLNHPDSGTLTNSIMSAWSPGEAARTLSSDDEDAYQFLYN